MTPNDIEILIHYHSSPAPHPRIHAPAVQESIRNFLKDGILEIVRPNVDDTFTTTEKGRAWLRMILDTPYPTLVWVDANGGKIEY